jgi:hypothetical protein
MFTRPITVTSSAPTRSWMRFTSTITLAAIATTVIAGDCGTSPTTALLLEGDAAPDTGDSYQTFDRPNISEAGHVAFAGDTDGETSGDDVVYVDARLVAREGTPAPGAKGGLFGSFEFFETGHQVNAAGEVAFISSLTGVPSDENRALYHEATLVVREGQEVAGISGRQLVDLGFAGLTDDGRVGYLADLDGSTSDDSVIVLDGAVLYREGDPAPGLPGVFFDGDFDEIQWNGAGDLLFEGNTSLPGAQDWVLFRRRTVEGGIVEDAVAQEGQLIQTRDGADFLELILQSALAENGDWAMRGNLGVAPSAADAIIITGAGVQVQQGDPIPELPGAVLGNFNGVDLNSHGDLLYLADIEGASGIDEGLFLNGCLLITDGMQAPGLPEGTLLTDIGFEDTWINDAGQIVFAAGYQGGDGLFRLDITGSIPCTGDVDGDALVGFSDLTLVLANFGACPGGGEPCPADVDDDGTVAFSDLTLVLASWGPCP